MNKNALIPVRLRETVNELRQVINYWFDRLVQGRSETSPALSAEPFFTSLFDLGGYPAVDVEETADEIIVTAEVPGLSEKDFEVELQGQRLIIRGEKKVQQEKKDRSYYYSECQYGSFSRIIPLPCEVIAEKASAKYKNGIVEIHLPKSESAKSHRVQIKVE
ncbi:MAG: Hsp20/alpha crystallin family protein [Candidatus Hydrogenedentes bacterium]|nr:Hsp20/alpha crystallin family protein [Candidatus Hydrogenedentota bacterium]